jgi:protein SCO1/2
LHGTVKSAIALLGLMLQLSAATTVTASQASQSSQQREQSKSFTADPAPAHIPDINVVDQNGKPHHFYSELVRGKVVVINFVYTTCTTICPPLGATFGKLQKNLGQKLGKDVFLISISVDPVTDTPTRLRAWGAQFGAKPGWTLVTGEKTELNRLLRVLGADTASPESHSPLVLIVNDKAALWKRVYGLGASSALMHSIEQMIVASSSKTSETEQ